MTRIKQWAVVAALMGAIAFFVPATASAAPTGDGLTTPAATTPSGVQKVHWRGWRHCHWRYGKRFCHGKRGWRRYGGGPTIYLRFGNRRDGDRRRWRNRRRDRD